QLFGNLAVPTRTTEMAAVDHYNVQPVFDVYAATDRRDLGSVARAIAVILAYLLMAINFQSWLDPLVIVLGLPGALAGILWMLFATHTTFTVPALMGTIMAVGVATSNSILLIVFAEDQRRAGRS